MLSSARFSVFVTTRLSAGSTALMVAGALARATDGVMVDFQVAAFEPMFEADLAPVRGAPGPEGQPTLAERGFYDAKLAWAVAKATQAYEARTAARGDVAPPAYVPPPKSGRRWIIIVLGLVALGGIAKLARRKDDGK
jgi:hypothetical protein